MSDALGITAAAVAILVGLCTLIGISVRFALVPYLETHLINPQRVTRELVEETHKQVTVNHHSSEQPTVLDRIDDVAHQVAENTQETRALARMFDGHLEQAAASEIRVQAEVDRIWRELRNRRDRYEP
jgi:hypothetical protein